MFRGPERGRAPDRRSTVTPESRPSFELGSRKGSKRSDAGLRGHRRKYGGPNANGADPKVDPTLTSAWSSRTRHLAPSVVAVDRAIRRSSFRRLGHRRSHRHPVPLVGWSGSEDPFRPSGSSETGSSVGLSPLAPQFRPKPKCLAWRATGSIRPMVALLSRSSRTTDLHRTEVLNMTISKTARTATAISIWFENFRSFNPLGLSVQRFLPRLDDLKVPLEPESRKLARGGLSTVHAFGCGQPCITQRLIALRSNSAQKTSDRAGRAAADAVR